MPQARMVGYPSAPLTLNRFRRDVAVLSGALTGNTGRRAVKTSSGEMRWDVLPVVPGGFSG